MGYTEKALETSIELTETTMLAALMNCILEQLRELPKAWDEMGETDQDDFLTRIELQCRATVVTAVKIISTLNRTCIEAKVDSVTFKDGVKVVMKLNSSCEGKHDLADAEGFCRASADLVADRGREALAACRRGKDV